MAVEVLRPGQHATLQTRPDIEHRSVDMGSGGRKRRWGRFDQLGVNAVYARFALHTADPTRLSEVVSHYEHEVSTVFAREPGSRGVSVLVNDDLGVALVEAFWSTAEAMRSNDATFADPTHDAAFFGATVSIEHYEIARFVHVAPVRTGAAVSQTRLETDPTTVEGVLAAYDDQSIESLVGSDGFSSVVLFLDRQSGRALVEATWRDVEALVAARSVVAARRLEAVSTGTAVVRGIEQYRLDFHAVELE